MSVKSAIELLSKSLDVPRCNHLTVHTVLCPFCGMTVCSDCNLKHKSIHSANFDAENSFDIITAFDAIHDQANPEKVLENIKKALKSDGIFMMQDIRASSKLENNMNHSLAPYLYTVSCLHGMTVSLALEGKGLGAMWGKELQLRC